MISFFKFICIQDYKISQNPRKLGAINTLLTDKLHLIFFFFLYINKRRKTKAQDFIRSFSRVFYGLTENQKIITQRSYLFTNFVYRRVEKI